MLGQCHQTPMKEPDEGELGDLVWEDPDEPEWAAGHGDLELVKQIRARNPSLPWNPFCCENAARYGHLHVLQWLRTNGCPWEEYTFSAAVRGGHWHVVLWLRSEGCPWGERACAAAAGEGRFELLSWLRSEGCPWDVWTCACAANGGHLDVLKWARTEQTPPCPWDETTCSSAAEAGHLDVLQWARSQGCPWDGSTCSAAAREGHLDVLQWAWLHGCPRNEEQSCVLASAYSQWATLHWLMRVVPSPPLAEIQRRFRYCAQKQYYEALQWLASHQVFEIRGDLRRWLNAVDQAGRCTLNRWLCSDLVQFIQSYC